MIKIKDYIFNENEILKIKEDNNVKVKQFDDEVRVETHLFILFKDNLYDFDIRATLEDIEWNYEDKETNYLKYREKELKNYNEILDNQYQDKLKKIEELEEENKKKQEAITNLIKDSANLEDRINKAIEYYKEQCDDIVDYNKADLLKILKGEE